jgi:hypothetical protein
MTYVGDDADPSLERTSEASPNPSTTLVGRRMTIGYQYATDP